ncbi:MAG: ABC transporter ATP-binding protein [Bacteroidales bacterium]|nr:ABC transporter ATP-binding protein [Bacteroidales bacterium]MDD4670570.1 ABC transporter ATP-binding protein [Bacteroidales bacterium]
MKQQITLSAFNLGIGYRLRGGKEKVIHPNLNLQLYSGQVTCLLGMNGAGKSTLLRTLCRFQPSLSGEIEIMGKPINLFTQSELSLTVGVVLTEKTNAGGITVFELVSLGRHPHTGFFGQLKEEDYKIISASLDAVGITHKSDTYISELSDGERQKVMIAKVLAQECPIIVLDEPTAFLDVTSRIEIMILLRKLAKEQNKSILLSTHDLDLAIQMGDCLWLQSRDNPMKRGVPEDLILDNSLESFFRKDGIVFDRTTGKLSSPLSKIPVGVEGDFNTSYWAGNALTREGYLPSTPSADYTSIKCVSPTEIEIKYANGTVGHACSIEEMLKCLTNRIL